MDFRSFAGKRIGILGAGSSAFDNAGEALEAGAKQVMMFARRPALPQVNKSKWTAFPGFQLGYASLDDARRWRFYTYILGEQVPPPYESVLRCEKHPGFSLRFSEGWKDIVEENETLKVLTDKDRPIFDALVVCTGFDVNLVDRPEIASFRDSIETWRSPATFPVSRPAPRDSRRVSRETCSLKTRTGTGNACANTTRTS